METDNKLTDEQINNIAETLESAVPDEVIDIRDIQKTVEVNPDAELESATLDTVQEPNPIDLIAAEVEKELDSDEIPELTEEEQIAAEKRAAEDAKDNFDLTDEEMYQLFETMSKIRENPKYPVYSNIPDKFQKMVRDLARQNELPASQWNSLARMIIMEMIQDTGLNDAFIDLEKSLNSALSLPSISDLYSEHTREVMEIHIPETIEKIKDEFPEKAEMLGKVRDAFKESYTFSFAKEEYKNNSRVRKAVRRSDNEKELKHCLTDFNGRNDKSKFKMNDITEVAKVLTEVLINRPQEAKFIPEYIQKKIDYIKNGDENENNSNVRFLPIYNDDVYYGYVDTNDSSVRDSIKENVFEFGDKVVYPTEEDIKKFIILITKSCESKDPLSVIDASYMYYMMRNIIMLKHTQEAKTDFAAELISNIIETISFITNEEANFYASNSDSKSKKKLHS